MGGSDVSSTMPLLLLTLRGWPSAAGELGLVDLLVALDGVLIAYAALLLHKFEINYNI